MLTELHEDGKLDVLRAIRDGALSPLEVYSASRTGRIPYVASDIVLHQPLWPAVEAWLPKSARAKSTRDRYGNSVSRLRGTLGKHLTVSDLARVDWASLRDDWPNSGADYNRMRGTVSRFLTMVLGDKMHPFRRKVMSDFPRGRESRGRVPEINVPAFWRIMGHMPEGMVPCYVTLAVTGLRVGSEYCALQEHHLRPLTREIEVPGTKTEGSAGVVRVGEKAWPWIVRAVPAPLKYDSLYRYWRQACEAAGVCDVHMHDLRHLLGMELTEAGRSEASVQATLRHDTPAMTRRYSMRKDRGENARKMDELMFPGHPKEAEDAG
jgi:integrase